MFNDESSSVRFNAITSISKMGRKWPLVVDEDLLQSFLLVLHDGDLQIRKAAHNMLGYMT